MQGSDTRNVDKTYGPWAWVAGMALGAVLTWIMFVLATGFS